MDCRIKGTEVYKQRISPRTEFMFVRAIMSSGEEGWGEASFNALNEQVLVAIRILAEAVLNRTANDALNLLARQPNWKNGRAYRIAVNALELAVLDAGARTRQIPLHEILGKRRNDIVQCYANINRGTLDRTPGGWARRARTAVASGFKTVKLAPFDGVGDGPTEQRLAEAKAGIAVVGSVRREVGESIGLMVDCHWRFDEQSAVELVRCISDLSVEWIESPVHEDFESISELRRIRAAANRKNVMLAGGEYNVGERSFATFLREEVYDTINPDIRFCGIFGMARIAEMAAETGTGFAPHNHLGPVMTAASLQVMAVAPTCGKLELQHAEGAAASCLTEPRILAPVDGILQVPCSPGLGIGINRKLLSAVRL